MSRPGAGRRRLAATEIDRIGSVQVEGVTVVLGGRVVVAPVDLVAPAGRWLTITGPSGSGKSILLEVLCGLRAPSTGRVLIDAQPAWGPGPARHDVGIVLQESEVLTQLTVYENVALPLLARGLPAHEVRRRAERRLAELGIDGIADQSAGALSGGQRQRVAVARGLALEAPVVCCDEPASELDATNRRHVLDLLRAEAAAGAVMIVASLDPSVGGAGDDQVTLGLPAVERGRTEAG